MRAGEIRRATYKVRRKLEPVPGIAECAGLAVAATRRGGRAEAGGCEEREDASKQFNISSMGAHRWGERGGGPLSKSASSFPCSLAAAPAASTPTSSAVSPFRVFLLFLLLFLRRPQGEGRQSCEHVARNMNSTSTPNGATGAHRGTAGAAAAAADAGAASLRLCVVGPMYGRRRRRAGEQCADGRRLDILNLRGTVDFYSWRNDHKNGIVGLVK